MRSSRPTAILTATLLAASGALLGQPGLIFSDGFESGDLSRWNPTVAASCIAAPTLGGLLRGELGPAPPGGTQITCLEVRNDQDSERFEVAVSGIPIPRATNLLSTASLAVVGAGGQRLAAQFDVLARWGGPVDRNDLPIRWLQVSLPSRVPAESTSVYALRSYPGLTAPNDPFAVTLTPQGSTYVVDTGLATFTLGTANPALFDEIAVDLDNDGQGRLSVYTHLPGAGPRLSFGNPALSLDTSQPGAVAVDGGPSSFQIVEAGPLRAVVMLKGHFAAPAGASRCTRDGLDYERFGYTLVATFVRGSRDVELRYHLRNECSNGDGPSWTDDAILVAHASWSFPFSGLGSTGRYYAGLNGAISSGATSVRVAQEKSTGAPSLRRASIRLDGAVQSSGTELQDPVVAVADSQLLVAAQMPWMRYREPQALTVDGTTLSLAVVSEPVVLGEGKGLWNLGKLSLVPVDLVSSSLTDHLDRLRVETRWGLERGLLVHAALNHINDSRIYPGLGVAAANPPSLLRMRYLEMMERLHRETVSGPPGGESQWERARTYGSQIWPDVQTDPFFEIPSPEPSANNVSMNYWNPSGAELLEFFRSGDPKWVWEFALPQSWLQAHTAYLNVGDANHSNRNGVAVESGGTGEGHWHRTGGGSDDYSYNMGLDEAYLIRPNPVLRDRFAQAGRSLVARYSIPQSQQASRDPFVNGVDLTRGNVQHFEMLANCAELVPGADGQACHDRLLELLGELAQDNLRAGVLCQGDLPSLSQCDTPQQFMQNALMYPFLYRMWRNYGDPTGYLRKALVGGPSQLYEGITKEADGVSLVIGGDSWPGRQLCQLNQVGAELEVASCAPALDSDNRYYMWDHNKPHSAALLLIAHEIEPSLGLCGLVRSAFDDPSLTGAWAGSLFNDAGWVKASAQMMQAAVFAVGLYESCSD